MVAIREALRLLRCAAGHVTDRAGIEQRAHDGSAERPGAARHDDVAVSIIHDVAPAGSIVPSWHRFLGVTSGDAREHPCGGACLDHKMRINNRKLQEAFWRIERQKIVVLEALSNS